MEELNRLSMSMMYIRSKEYKSYIEVDASENSFHTVMKRKKNKEAFATSITRLDNGNYVVDTLTLKNEYKGKNNSCTKEKAIQILAGILEALS